jgi:predicted transposase YdaD
MAQHDSGYKLLFSHPQMVEELLRGFVHEPWVEDLDYATLEPAEASFTSADLRERHGDRVWRLRWRGGERGWLYLYLLLEFQSTPEPFMAVRLPSSLTCWSTRIGSVLTSWPCRAIGWRA